MEQITYLLFIKRLDELQTLEENRASRLGEPMRRTIFPAGPTALPTPAKDGRPYADLRWSRFKHLAPAEMYEVVGEHVFPFLRTLGGEGSTYATHMRDARFTIPTPGLLQKAVDGLDEIPMVDRDTKGDVYEYMLGKIATAGQNGQFRTPRHIIQLMVEMMAPTPTDVICDPACGTCGFLVAAGEYIRAPPSRGAARPRLNRHFHHEMFNGFDFDNTMLRIGSMNMLLHGVEQPDVRYRDSLAQEHAGDDEAYSLVLANPPFAGSLDYENTAKDLLQVVKTKKTELLFLALFLRLLKPGGRAAVIVPDGVLFGSTKAHKELRRILVEDQKPRRDRVAAVRRVQALRRRVDRHPAVHQDELRRHRARLVLRPHCRRLQPRRQAHAAAACRQARRGPGRGADRRGARQEQPARRPRPMGRARRCRAGAGPHRPELLRPQGRHRRRTTTTSASTGTRRSSTRRSSSATPGTSSRTWPPSKTTSVRASPTSRPCCDDRLARSAAQ